MEKKWHTVELSSIEKKLNTSFSSGLPRREAKERLEGEARRDGGERRSLFVPRGSNIISNALSFFAMPGVLAVTVISGIAALFGSTYEELLVFILMLTGALFGGIVLFTFLKRSERMYEYASPMACVERGGKAYHTDGKNLVCGDIVLLSRGDVLSCDVRLITSQDLTVKELITTKKGIRNRVLGKDALAVYSSDSDVNSFDAANMVYAGSAVIGGKARGVVVSTGGDVCLMKGNKDGVLSGGEDMSKSVDSFSQITLRTAFFVTCALVILTLISIVTFKGRAPLSCFLTLASALSMISCELLHILHKCIFSSYIDRISKKKNKKRDVSAYIRDRKTLETLADVTDIVLLGRAAYTDGVPCISEVMLQSGEIKQFEAGKEDERWLSRNIYYYLKALGESGVDSDIALSGAADAIMSDLLAKGFDKKGAELVLSSLYFAPDEGRTNGYACVETFEDQYRVMLTGDRSAISYCSDIDGKCLASLKDFEERTEKERGSCLYLISESRGKVFFEGALSLYEKSAEAMPKMISELMQMGINVTTFISDGDLNAISETTLKECFGDRIAYASSLSDNEIGMSALLGKYNVYVGFEPDMCAELIESLRAAGACVAAYGIADKYYKAMSKADVSISSDTVEYSTQRHNESMYEKLPHAGGDTNLRCSQLTRVLSRVIVKRVSTNGGGLSSIENAMIRSREARVSFRCAVYFMICMMCTLLPIAAMQSVVGVSILNAVQTSCLALFISLFPIMVFSGIEPLRKLVFERSFEGNDLKELVLHNKRSLTARISANIAFCSIVKITDAFGLFGDAPTYTMPVFISALIISAFEIFLFNKRFTRRGAGRRRTWTAFLTAYVIVLLISALMTQTLFANDMFPSGIGTYEFILTALHCFMYFAALAIAYLADKARNKY